MNDHRESDSRVVPAKPANKAEESAAELAEGRRLDKGNTDQQNARRTLSRDVSASSALDRVRQVAVKDRNARFTVLLHHVDVDRLRGAYRALSPKAAAGVDGETWESYGQNLEGNLRDLLARVQRGAYRAKPTRRAYIPKPDGRLRPLGVAALEDKILQRAVVEVLNAIYGKRRTTGMEKEMRELYIEGLAIHGGPDHALATREGAAKRWFRGYAGRPLSLEMRSIGVPTRSYSSEGNTAGSVTASRQRTLRGLRTRHACDVFMLRTGRAHDHSPVVMEGRVVRGRPRP